jgi:hypothetical protein
MFRGDLTPARLCRPILCRFATIPFPRDGNPGKACQTVCAVALLPGPRQTTATATTAVQQQPRCSNNRDALAKTRNKIMQSHFAAAFFLRRAELL